jgi:hypothetical protein
MAKIPLDQLSAEELRAAREKFRELEESVERNATDFPGPGWETVRDMLDEAGAKLALEEKRRYGQ